MVAQDLLDFEQVHAGLDEVRGIAVTQAVRGDLSFSPQSSATWRSVFCTPPRSSGVRARWHPPGLAQHVQGVELQAVQVVLDRAAGVGGDQVAEVVGELGPGQVVDLVVEILAHAPDGARVDVDGLGLQALELEVFEVALVALVEVSTGVGHVAVSLGETLHNHSIRIDGVRCAA